MNTEFKELIMQALELIDEAYNMTDYNTKECDVLIGVKNNLDNLID